MERISNTRKLELSLKILGLVSILLIYTANRPISDEITGDGIWMKDYTLAKNKAADEDKPLLIYFSGSDWCKPCIQLSAEVFDQEEFVSYAEENLVLLRLDFPRNKKNRLSVAQTRHNEALAARYNREGSFPMVLIVDKNDDVLMQTGYRHGGAAGFVAYLEKTLARL